MIIYLLKNYNNYYNRIIKRSWNIADYITAVGSNGYAKRGTSAVIAGGNGPVNFNINDGITADVTYNYIDGQDWTPDYVLCVNDADDTILYRFFVMEAVRTRKYQYRLTLRRDIVADEYNSVIDAPMFLERATINDQSSAFLYQSEGIRFNQIKDENEILLKDGSKHAWIVGYIDRKTTGDAEAKVYATSDYTTASGQNIDAWMSANITQGLVYDEDSWEIQFKAEEPNSTYYANFYAAVNGDYFTLQNTLSQGAKLKAVNADIYPDEIISRRPSTLGDYVGAYINTQIPVGGTITQSVAASSLSYNNKVVFDTTTSKYYKITVSQNNFNPAYYHYNIIDSGNSSVLFNSIKGWFVPTFFTATGSGSDYSSQGTGFYLSNIATVSTITMSKTEVSEPYSGYKVNLPATRNKINDVPYCMFAIPFEAMNYKIDNGTIQTNNTQDINLAIASAIVEKMGDALYDIQLLPYCPKMDNVWGTTGTPYLWVNDADKAKEFSYITDAAGTTNYGLVLWCNSTRGTLNIPCAISGGSNALEAKLINETELWRLSSPNYNAFYEFNAAKNRGIHHINVDYEYKPFTPYIHLNPYFNNLYGADTNDARGLICAGDFSLPNWTNQYQQYVINNKNYQQMFDRQIDSMDVMHSIDKEQRNWQALAGVVGGAAAGAKLGGGGAGSIVGGVAGAAAGIAGAAIDWRLQEARFSEQKSYAIDSFNLTMDSIKARPDVLTKVSAYNPNNKIWPFIEHYHATPEEIEALTNKLKYNGMTLNNIGRMRDYLQSDYSFIKGKLIRFENSGLEFHEQMQLAQELEEGVYIK